MINGLCRGSLLGQPELLCARAVLTWKEDTEMVPAKIHHPDTNGKYMTKRRSVCSERGDNRRETQKVQAKGVVLALQ